MRLTRSNLDEKAEIHEIHSEFHADSCMLQDAPTGVSMLQLVQVVTATLHRISRCRIFWCKNPAESEPLENHNFFLVRANNFCQRKPMKLNLPRSVEKIPTVRESQL